MEGAKMQKVLTVATNIITMHRYACLCGHMTLTRRGMVRHLNTHPADELGILDAETGHVRF